MDTKPNPLDDAVAQIASMPLAGGPSEELKSATAVAMSREAARIRRWRRQIRYAAIAATVAIALGVVMLLSWRDRSSVTFAQVIEQVEKTHTVQGTSDEPGFYHGLPFYIKGKHERAERANPYWQLGHYVEIMDLEKGETLTIAPELKTSWLDSGTANALGDLYTKLKEVADHPVKNLGEKEFDGRKLVGFYGLFTHHVRDGKPYRVPVNIWVDPKTRLPVRMEMVDPVRKETFSFARDLQFDVPLDDSLFAMTPPPQYKFRDQRTHATLMLRPPATTQTIAKLILHPGVGIGDVKLGDPESKLIAFLGPPEVQSGSGVDGRERQDDYPALGLRFCFEWTPALVNSTKDWKKLRPEDQILRSFFVDSAAGSPHTPARDFAGMTDRGIRLGSTRQEVEAIYGKPAWENLNNADYRELGMSVTYDSEGKLVSGFIILKPSKEPIFGFLEDVHANTTAPATMKAEPEEATTTPSTQK